MTEEKKIPALRVVILGLEAMRLSGAWQAIAPVGTTYEAFLLDWCKVSYPDYLNLVASFGITEAEARDFEKNPTSYEALLLAMEDIPPELQEEMRAAYARGLALGAQSARNHQARGGSN